MPLYCRRISATMAVLMIIVMTFGGELNRGVERDQSRIQKLESQLETQRRKIDQLQVHLSASTTRNNEAARVEVMRQQIREILGESAFRESLMQSTVTAGYDKGFLIRGSDDKFSLKINGRLQFRWTHYATRGTNRYLRPGLQRNDRTGFDVQRLRLGFKGHAYDPKLTYRVELRAGASARYDFGVQYSYVNYRFAEEFQIKAGIFKIAATRAQMTSSANL